MLALQGNKYMEDAAPPKLAISPAVNTATVDLFFLIPWIHPALPKAYDLCWAVTLKKKTCEKFDVGG